MYQNDPQGLYYSDFEEFKIGGSEVYWAGLPVLGRSTLKSLWNSTMDLSIKLYKLNKHITWIDMVRPGQILKFTFGLINQRV